MTPERACVIATVPRTGSTFLCRAMTLTGVLGRPLEHFGPHSEAEFARRFRLEIDPTSWGPYLDVALQHGTTPNGVFATKLFRKHAGRLASRAGAAAWPEVLGGDVRAVRLTRSAIDAAVSHWRASTSGQWHRSPEDPALPMPPIDVAVIEDRHRRNHEGDDWWDREVDRHGLPVLRVGYGDLVADLAGVVRSVAGLMDVTLERPVVTPYETVRQADAASLDAIAAWEEATGGCAACRR